MYTDSDSRTVLTVDIEVTSSLQPAICNFSVVVKSQSSCCHNVCVEVDKALSAAGYWILVRTGCPVRGFSPDCDLH